MGINEVIGVTRRIVLPIIKAAFTVHSIFRMIPRVPTELLLALARARARTNPNASFRVTILCPEHGIVHRLGFDSSEMTARKRTNSLHFSGSDAFRNFKSDK